ncbi:MAG: double-strand break repair protein AddB [Beijerinckiaceae bacterium]|nr:double-strand break repair protein AddB [Beijerinckiaceae bacterium]MCZ8299369.1 double-strand break repair protein AddB [Beijerinckiaceae bacterium]
MARAVPQVLTIGPGTDFVTCLVDALLDGRLLPVRYESQPDALADLTIFVPTQRLRAALRDRLLAATAPRPVLLPQIRALGEPWDPLEETLDSIAEPDEAGPLRPLDTLRRRFLLLPLVSAWHQALTRLGDRELPAAEGPHAMRERLALADALGSLIDETIIADLPLDLLARAAPPGYDASRHDIYWEQTRRFLQIAAEAWPGLLAEQGFADAKALRRSALDAESRRIHEGAAGAFLLAGSTGSVPVTARLMRAIARHDAGAVVLPGLDLDLQKENWDLIGHEQASLATRFAHAQSHLKATLATIGLPREAVTPLDRPSPALRARNRLISEALGPAETVHLWRKTRETRDLATATEGVIVLEAPDPRREALAIAVLIRETLDTPGRNVALVTADRALALRVQSELKRWGLSIEDSAGLRLRDLQAGQLAILLLRAVEEPSGAHLLALLRHPDLRLGLPEAELARTVTALEMAVFRQRRPGERTTLQKQVEEAFDQAEAAGQIAGLPERADLLALAEQLEGILAPLRREEPGSLPTLLERFVEALDALTRPVEGAPLWRSHPSGIQLTGVLESLLQAAAGQADTGAKLREILRSTLAEAVLPAAGGHRRAAILGPLEARLVSTDRLILGGMNEGQFPPAAREDPFLNRTMRLHLGLTPPERRIGQSAHDFQMLAGHLDLVLSRARHGGEGPAQPSRFWRRLEALCGAEAWKGLTARGDAVLDLSGRLDESGVAPQPASRPAPIPAAPRVPARLAITDIEPLRRDPFVLYARLILGLKVLNPVDPPIDARDRGTLVHQCLELYAAEEPPQEPEAAQARLRAIGEAVFGGIRSDPARHAFWWRPFERLIPAFVAFDRARRDQGFTVLPEQRARFPLVLPTGDSVLMVGKADRLEYAPAGDIAVFDYKTGGSIPSKTDLAKGLAPQLPMTGALALRGAFPKLPPARALAELAYFALGDRAEGKAEPILAGEETEQSEAIWQFVVDELTALAMGEKGYASRVNPVRRQGPGDFDHLARVREWDALGGTEADDEGDGDDENA